MSDMWEEDGDPWTVKSAERVFENDWLALDRHHVIHPGGAEGTYTVVRPGRLAVGVLPIEADGAPGRARGSRRALFGRCLKAFRILAKTR